MTSKRFSERLGIVSPKTIIQKDSIDKDLRIALWNCLYEVYLVHYQKTGLTISFTTGFGLIFKLIWAELLNQPLTEIPNNWSVAINNLETIFSKGEWNKVYDLVEFIANNIAEPVLAQKFINLCNKVLEQYLSGYRFVGMVITPNTSDTELQSIQEALDITTTLTPVHTHLQEALIKLSDRTSPDYRNSIKESISAVEALCRKISGNPKVTLGDALNLIEKSGKIKIHSALKNGFSNIYGWTSDAQGIRHSLMDEATLNFEDANFMLVSLRWSRLFRQENGQV
jgi:hypothetical protein